MYNIKCYIGYPERRQKPVTDKIKLRIIGDDVNFKHNTSKSSIFLTNVN